MRWVSREKVPFLQKQQKQSSRLNLEPAWTEPYSHNFILPRLLVLSQPRFPLSSFLPPPQLKAHYLLFASQKFQYYIRKRLFLLPFLLTPLFIYARRGKTIQYKSVCLAVRAITTGGWCISHCSDVFCCQGKTIINSIFNFVPSNRDWHESQSQKSKEEVE